jgi:hypothetical protein
MRNCVGQDKKNDEEKKGAEPKRKEMETMTQKN